MIIKNLLSLVIVHRPSCQENNEYYREIFGSVKVGFFREKYDDHRALRGVYRYKSSSYHSSSK